jgi:small subunit ribosomal protein S21
MLIIEVKRDLERALKVLKKKFNSTRVLKELRSRKEFKKKSVRTRETLRAAIDREQWKRDHS